jgi:hypothetical protein
LGRIGLYRQSSRQKGEGKGVTALN